MLTIVSLTTPSHLQRLPSHWYKETARRKMEGNMVSYMGSLVFDWLLSAGDKKLAEKFRKEVKP